MKSEAWIRIEKKRLYNGLGKIAQQERLILKTLPHIIISGNCPQATSITKKLLSLQANKLTIKERTKLLARILKDDEK